MKYMLMLIDYDETKTTKEQDEEFLKASIQMHKAASVSGSSTLYLITEASKRMYDRIKIELARMEV
jgi:hypothetical protein